MCVSSGENRLLVEQVGHPASADAERARRAAEEVLKEGPGQGEEERESLHLVPKAARKSVCCSLVNLAEKGLAFQCVCVILCSRIY